jgi:uncharacterized protein YdaT
MPWTNRNYPPSLKNFDKRLRNKAVDIANALLEEGYEEGRAIAIATAQAKEWIEKHPDHSKEAEGPRSDHASASEPARDRKPNIHVVPHEGRWAIKREGAEEPEPEHVIDSKAEAVDKAQKLASDDNISAIVHRKDGTVEKSHNYH